MLCLSLSEGEYVMIGDSIKVHFNRTKGKDLVLGVEAPREVEIKRGNAYEHGLKKKAEDGNTEALKLSKRLEEEHAERRSRYPGRTAVSNRNASKERRVAV